MALSAPTSPYIRPLDPAEQVSGWRRFSKWMSDSKSPDRSHEKGTNNDQVKPSLGRRLSRKVVPGLPRPPTFKRQLSEKRDRLMAVEQSEIEKRTHSLDRRRARSVMPFTSSDRFPFPEHSQQAQSLYEPLHIPAEPVEDQTLHQIRPMPPFTPPAEPHDGPGQQIAPLNLHGIPQDILEQMNQELECKWILNLSMHFRDNSPREKFFVTYAETPTKWRRVTVSCDYRDAPPDSLEYDLHHLTHQREKNARIYDAIRNSLPDILFYDSITNLRLQTDQDDRLHVHVSEDVNEIIHYPSVTSVKHLDYVRVDERDVSFDSHMSGFVYRVRVHTPAFDGKVCVKKEIPGPDSVEEFLYEINVLNALVGTPSVIQFEGLVVDEHDLVKGLLISYANQGPLVDLIYDFKGTGSLTWSRKAKWARQMIYGLSAIHEAGFVQGDCTLSNIVIDEHDDAMIIDVNRRGCPVGWEPPEIHKMVDSGHRIGMYIGTKSDLFQLGMSLWALITEEDEPERQLRPLEFSKSLKVPPEMQYLLDVTNICLSEKPRDRLSAENLLSIFPAEYIGYAALSKHVQHDSAVMEPSDRDTVYLDSVRDMEEDIERKHFHHIRSRSASTTRFRSTSPESEPDKRGYTPPDDANYIERDIIHIRDTSEADVERFSVGSDEDNKYANNIYGIDCHSDDEQAAQRIARRRHRIPNLNTAVDNVTASDFEHVSRGLKHTDSGIDANMHTINNTPNEYCIYRGLDHIDSGLADMDLESETKFARHDTDLHDIAEGKQLTDMS